MSPSEPKWDHLFRLTDDCGLIQHARGSVPLYQSGYTLDDNARALLVALEGYRQQQKPEFLELVRRYLAFILWTQQPDGRFVNFVSYDRRFLEPYGSQESQGRALLALAEVCRQPVDQGVSAAAEQALEHALPQAKFSALRAAAYGLVAALTLLKNAEKSEQVQLAEALRQHCRQLLVEAFQRTAEPNWAWFEPTLTWGNGLLPWALWKEAAFSGDPQVVRVASQSLDFLNQVCTAPQGYTALVGNRGWYARGAGKAIYDEQPIDAADLLLANVAAFQVAEADRYLVAARRAYAWFHGENRLGCSLFDPASGGCRDGLGESEVNLNEGAESLLAYLGSTLMVRQLPFREQWSEVVPLAV